MVPSSRLSFPGSGRVAAIALLCCAGAGAEAAEIYSCVDGSGRRLTSDRPIAECSAREQRLLNSDGSVRRVVPPIRTVDEQTEYEARERKAAADRAAQQDAVRRDRNLLLRFPDEATHRKAREAALDDVEKGVRFSENRLKELERERKPLISESEFYAGKQVPLKLRQQLDANDAAVAAQKSLVQNQEDEIVRINNLYDVELERLKKLWSGSAPGSMGALPAASAPPVRKAAGK